MSRPADDAAPSAADTPVQDSDRKREALKIRIAFAIVPITHATGSNIVTILALRYFTDNLGMAASIAGLLFGVVKIYDGLIDPLLGALSDRTKTRIGRRLPYLLIGSGLMSVSVLFLFAAPESLSPTALWFYVAAVLIVHATAYTALTIPGLAMVVEVTDDYHERSTLMSYRVIGNSVGLLLGSTLPAWLLANWGADRIGHIRAAAVVAAIVAVAGVAATLMLLRAPRTESTDNSRRIRLIDFVDQLRVAWHNRPYRLLAIAHVFILMATTTPTVSNAYFTRYVLERTDNWLGTYFMLSISALFIATPIWLRVARALDKKKCYVAAMLGWGLIHLSWLPVTADEPYPLMVARAILSGIAAAGLMLFAYSMLTDAIRYDYILTGQRREGVFAGITSLLDKLSMAAGIAGTGVLMSAMGYQESSSGGLVTQSETALRAIYIGFAVVPAIAVLGGVVAIWRYRLTPDDLREPVRGKEAEQAPTA